MVERTSTCMLQVRKEEQALHAPSPHSARKNKLCMLQAPILQGRTSSACSKSQVRKEEQALHAPSLKSARKNKLCMLQVSSPKEEQALHAHKRAQSLLQVPREKKLCMLASLHSPYSKSQRRTSYARLCNALCAQAKKMLPELSPNCRIFKLSQKPSFGVFVGIFGIFVYFWMMRQFARKSPNCRIFFWLGPRNSRMFSEGAPVLCPSC